MQPDTKSTATQVSENTPPHEPDSQRLKMSAGWKIVFGILGSVLLLSIVSYVAMQIYYALAESNGWSILETQWWSLIWLLSMAPAGLVALIGLAVAYPVYRVQRAARSRHQGASVSVGETPVSKEHQWEKWLVILGLISFAVPLLSIVSVYLEFSNDMDYVIFATIGVSIITSVVQLVFIAIGLIYILSSNASIIKKSIVGFAVLSIILFTFFGAPMLEDAFYNETDTSSEINELYYDDSSEYYEDEYPE